MNCNIQAYSFFIATEIHSNSRVCKGMTQQQATGTRIIIIRLLHVILLHVYLLQKLWLIPVYMYLKMFLIEVDTDVRLPAPSTS